MLCHVLYIDHTCQIIVNTEWYKLWHCKYRYIIMSKSTFLHQQLFNRMLTRHYDALKISPQFISKYFNFDFSHFNNITLLMWKENITYCYSNIHTATHNEMYHGTLRMYHDTLMYNGTFICTVLNFNVPWYFKGTIVHCKVPWIISNVPWYTL